MLGARPNVPAPAFTFRRYLRATVGYPIPLVRESNLTFRVPVLVELHDESYDVFPSHYWRGRAALELAFHWRDAEDPRRGYGLAVLLEHESNHPTGIDEKSDASGERFLASRFGTYFYLDDLGLRGAARWPFGDSGLTTAATLRYHFLTCTRADRHCENYAFAGAQSFEATVDLVFDTAAGQPVVGTWVFICALHGAYVAPNRLVTEELRLVANAGARIRPGNTGSVAMFAVGWLGSDVGMRRGERFMQLGVAVRWTP